MHADDDTLVYLDHNSTCPVLPSVVTAMLPYLHEHWGNAASLHSAGRTARAAVEQARAEVAALIGAPPEAIIFTSGGTEANNLAIRGTTAAIEDGRRHLVTSAIEHPAVGLPCRALTAEGWRVDVVPVGTDGRVDHELMIDRIDRETALVSLMHAQNETGVIQPVAAVAEAAVRAGAIAHTDASQSLGKIPVDVDELGVDLLTVAGHKLYGPKGVGALYVRPGTALRPYLLGAPHELGLRPGTQNVPAIVGLGEAARAAREALAAGAGERMGALADRLWAGLRAGIPGAVLSGEGVRRLPNTVHVRLPGTTGAAVLARLPGLAASTGPACHDGSPLPSAALLAMGVPAEAATGAIRLSLGRFTTEDEIDRAVAWITEAWHALVPAAH